MMFVCLKILTQAIWYNLHVTLFEWRLSKRLKLLSIDRMDEDTVKKMFILSCEQRKCNSY